MVGEWRPIARSGATTALLTADLPTAERVLDANTDLDKAAADWEHQAFSLLALQSPVAHDLRFAVGACATRHRRSHPKHGQS